MDSDDIEVAFFDVDETIIKFKTMFSFLEFFLDFKYKDNGKRFNKYFSNVKVQWENNIPREQINREYYKNFEGITNNEVKSAVNNWYCKMKEKGNLFHLHIYELIKKLKHQNVKIVLVSGSLNEVISPIALDIQADSILAINLESKNGLFTGNIIPPQTIGSGKREAVNNYIKSNGIDIRKTISYGDHSSDFDMLSATNKGFLYTDNKEIMKQGIDNNFMILDKRVFS